MNNEQKIDEILEAINSDSNKSGLSEIWDLFFTLEKLVFQCDRDRPRSPLIVNYNNVPTLLVFTSAEKARTFAEKSDNPKLFNDDGSSVTLTLEKNEAIAFIVNHFKNGIKQFLLNHGSDFLFGSSSNDFMVELNRHNGIPAKPKIDISDEFDAMVKQLQEGYSDTLKDNFWKKVIQLEKLYVVCPLDSPQKPDVQLLEIAKDQHQIFVIAFTNEQHATAYAVRRKYVTNEGKLNMMAAPCSAWIDSFARASDSGLYGVYFNPLTRPFHETLPKLIELNRLK